MVWFFLNETRLNKRFHWNGTCTRKYLKVKHTMCHFGGFLFHFNGFSLFFISFRCHSVKSLLCNLGRSHQQSKFVSISTYFNVVVFLLLSKMTLFPWQVVDWHFSFSQFSFKCAILSTAQYRVYTIYTSKLFWSVCTNLRKISLNQQKVTCMNKERFYVVISFSKW